jgi:hypothetical protein
LQIAHYFQRHRQMTESRETGTKSIITVWCVGGIDMLLPSCDQALSIASATQQIDIGGFQSANTTQPHRRAANDPPRIAECLRHRRQRGRQRR